jgi:hypothetical protein
MKFIYAASSCIALAIAAPMPAYSQLPTVQLRTFGLQTTHYNSPAQNPSRNGHILTLVIGTALSSLAQNPLFLQGLEIVKTEGVDNVYCKATVDHASRGVIVSSTDGMVMLDAVRGGVVQVTGLSCGFGMESL